MLDTPEPCRPDPRRPRFRGWQANAYGNLVRYAPGALRQARAIEAAGGTPRVVRERRFYGERRTFVTITEVRG